MTSPLDRILQGFGQLGWVLSFHFFNASMYKFRCLLARIYFTCPAYVMCQDDIKGEVFDEYRRKVLRQYLEELSMATIFA